MNPNANFDYLGVLLHLLPKKIDKFLNKARNFGAIFSNLA